MAKPQADNAGNTLGAVAVPVTGRAYIAPFGTPIPTAEQGKNKALQLNEAFKPLGLRTTDGAPEWKWEADGEALQFFEDGYSLPSGLANVTVTQKLAESNDLVREMLSGKKPDEHGYFTFDGGGHSTRYVLFTEVVFKNGHIQRRVAPNVTIKSMAEDKTERGAILGYSQELNIHRSPAINNDHFAQWDIYPT